MKPQELSSRDRIVNRLRELDAERTRLMVALEVIDNLTGISGSSPDAVIDGAPPTLFQAKHRPHELKHLSTTAAGELILSESETGELHFREIAKQAQARGHTSSPETFRRSLAKYPERFEHLTGGRFRLKQS